MDPTLKDTYDRIMGGALASPAPTASTTTPADTTPPPPSPVSTPSPAQQTPPAIPPASPPDPVVPLTKTSDQKTKGYVAPSAKRGISPVILGLGAVVFLLLYTLLWLRIFNVALPFIG